MIDNSYGKWLAKTMDKLGLDKATVIGISYGALLLNKLMAHSPEKITKGIFVVPSGFVNGPFLPSMRKLTIPLIRFLITKNEDRLLQFMDAFYNKAEAIDIAFQKKYCWDLKWITGDQP